MGDTIITIVAIFLAAMLMFVVPLMAVSERTDDISQLAVQTATSEFVDKISTLGAIRLSDYDSYVQTIYATGNTYDVAIEVQHLDENPGKKSATTSGNLIGENVRYSTYTTTILEELGKEDATYELKQGDIVIVTATNTNTTIAQLLRTFAYKITGKGTSQIAASASSMVVNSGN